MPFFPLPRACAFLDLKGLHVQDLLLVEQVKKRLAEGLGRHELGEAHQERGQQHQVGEHGDEKGHGDEQSERARAVEFTHREHEEPKEQHNRGVHHAHPGFADGRKDRSTDVPAIGPKLLPVFGQEEDAADVLSVVLIDAFYDEETAVQITYDAAYGFLGYADEQAETGEEPAFWDTHGPDLQRHYTLVCLFYGADAEERDDVAQELGRRLEAQF